MKIEKLPFGSYRIRKMFKGRTYTVVVGYKPTQKEALQLMAAELDRVQTRTAHLTFREASEKYVASKSNVLSPRTVKEYTEMPDRLSKAFADTLLADITQEDIQNEINRLAADKSPKTVRNYHGYISAVLGAYRPELNIRTTLPQKVKGEPYIPSDDDVRRILEVARETRYEIPLLLACYGMRRSEICALTLDDIEGDTVAINKAKVLNKDKEWVVKVTKTTGSTRSIIVPEYIVSLISEQGYIYKGHPNSITDFLEETQERLGIPKFSLHKLRHYFASKMSALKIPEADILKMGGWETDHVMKSVYRHATLVRDNDAMRDASSQLGNAILPGTTETDKKDAPQSL
jgi:integrase